MIDAVRRPLFWGAGLVLLCLLGLAVGRLRGGASATQEVERRPVPAVLASVGPEEFVDRIEAIGTLRSNESLIITAKVTETVRALHFEDGARVEEGAVLAELTSDEEAALLAEARSTHAEASQQYDRVQKLFAEGTVSRSQLDRATADRDAARARVEALEARLADRLIRAPFAGVLGLREVSPGTLLQPGDTITTLDDVSVMKLDFSVPEVFLSTLRPGLEVLARSAAYPDRSFEGRVRTVESRVDPVTRAVTVRAELANPGELLRPGMLLTVDLIRNRRTSLAVPEAALVPVRDEQFVFRVDSENRVERVPVRIGGRRPGRVEILAGLEDGDRVVVEGTTRVRPGSQVEVRAEP